MGFEFPRSICGIRSQRFAIAIGFLELVVHVLFSIGCINFVATYISEDELKKLRANETEAFSVDQNATTFNETDSDAALREFEENISQLFGFVKDVMFILATVVIVYEVICLPSILILICSLCKSCKCCTLPWILKNIYEIFVLGTLIYSNVKDLPLIAFFFFILICYEFFALFVVLSGIFTANIVELHDSGYMRPGDTELKMIGSHSQAHQV